MSDQEKNFIVEAVEKKGRRFVFWFGVLRTIVVLVGVFIMLERKTEAIFETPAKQAAMQKRDDSVFVKHDSVHVKHNGYFTVIFQHVDTTKKR